MPNMQLKISTFFKLKSPNRASFLDDLTEENSAKSSICIRYVPKQKEEADDGEGESGNERPQSSKQVEVLMKRDTLKYGRALNRKRTSVQLHLELGQKDFLLRTCSTCGFNYAPGDDGDEKVHATFHKSFSKGIRFKGWCNERVVHFLPAQGSRIILVLGDDGHAQRNKVQEVVKMMEAELGGGWILHTHCKAYLFISSQRIAGCLIAEPIRVAYRICSDSTEVCTKEPDSKKARLEKLQFGNIIFHRETMKRTEAAYRHISGAVFCEEEAVPAGCGVRAIWVSPLNRRKGIATHLLDAARLHFYSDNELLHSQLAFSQPTAAGRALASRYIGTNRFLVYKEADQSS